MKRTIENYFDRAREAAERIGAEKGAAAIEIREKLDHSKELAEIASDKTHNATTEEDFRRCLEAEREARALVDFYERQLDNIDHAPRMDGAEYDELCAGIDATVSDAARSFREVVSAAMDQIIEATKKYTDIISEADEALSALDKAANVLQSRYAERAITRSGMEPVYVMDANEWRQHVTRYGIKNYRSRGAELAFTDPKIRQAYNAAITCERMRGGIR